MTDLMIFLFYLCGYLVLLMVLAAVGDWIERRLP